MLALLAWVGCDDDSPSCSVATVDGDLLACIEYADIAAGSDARMSCEDNGGTWREAACDTGAVASCALFGSNTFYYADYLAGTGMTIADLRESCEQSSGDFTEL
jgi:hypothetical protein